MQYTQAQIDRANAVSLEDFLRTQGETLIKSGREYRWKEHDSLTVRGNKWFRHSQSKGGYERLGIAVDVWNLYHDFSDEAKSLGYLSCLGNIHSTSFPEETERLTDDLLNPAFRDIARPGTPRNFLQSMKARSRSTRPQRTILMDWASRSCPPSRR